MKTLVGEDRFVNRSQLVVSVLVMLLPKLHALHVALFSFVRLHRSGLFFSCWCCLLFTWTLGDLLFQDVSCLLVGQFVFPNLPFNKSGVVTFVLCFSYKLACSFSHFFAVPHCVSKFRPLFDDLYWSTRDLVSNQSYAFWSLMWLIFPGCLLMVLFSLLIVFVRLFPCLLFPLIVSVMLPYLGTVAHLFFWVFSGPECFGLGAVSVSLCCSVWFRRCVSVVYCLVLTLPSLRLYPWPQLFKGWITLSTG